MGEFLDGRGVAVEGPVQRFRIAPTVDFLGRIVQQAS